MLDFTSLFFLSLVGTLTFLGYQLYAIQCDEGVAPKDLPWIARRENEFLSVVRSKVRAMGNTRATMLQIYQDFTRLGKPIMMTFPFGRPQVVLPRSSIRWIIMQPDNVLSPLPIHDEVFSPTYTLRNPRLSGDFSVYSLLRRDLAKNLPALVPSVSEEICAALDEYWGLDTEWKPIRADDTVREIVTRAVNRMLVGKEICRNRDYNLNSRRLTLAIMPGAFFTHLFPEWARLSASKFTTAITRYFASRCMNHLRPVFTERIAAAEALKKDKSLPDTLPNDFITWASKEAVQNGENREGLEELLMGRLFIINFAAVETTSAAVTKTIYDVLTLGAKRNYMSDLEAEAHRVLQDCSRVPTKDDVKQLTYIESAIKEHLRTRTVFVSLQREVVHPQGVVTDTGIFLPHRARVCVSMLGIHNDDQYWTDAVTYDALRHARGGAASSSEAAAADEGNSSERLGATAQSLAAASESYMPFGLGRHSCPGRIFAADEMKLVLGHILQRYEIRYVGKERDGFELPESLNEGIEIRRRAGTVPKRE